MRWYSVLSCCAIAFLYLLYKKEAQDSSINSLANTLSCYTIKVIDGDTLIAECGDTTFRVRFSNIDAPEMAQVPYGIHAKKALDKLVANKHITLITQGMDIYQRVLASVYVEDTNVGKTLVEQGHAVVYPRYHPPASFINAQHRAKRERLGVWAKKGLQRNPSYFRRLQ